MNRRAFIIKGAAWTLAGGIFVPKLTLAHGLRGIRLRPDGVAVEDSFDGVTFYVNTASLPGGDGTTNLTSGASRAFSSENELLSSLSNLIDPTRAFLSGTAADTTGCTQAVWDFETTATNYLWLIGNNTTGKWNTSAWRMEITNGDAHYNNIAGHVRMQNMQVQLTGNSGANLLCFRLATANNLNGPVDHRFIGCIARMILGGATNVVGFGNSDPGSGGTCRSWNSIAYGGHYGWNSDGSGWAAANYRNYNDTAYGNANGFIDDMICANCLAAASTTQDFNSTGTTGHSNNAASDASAGGANARDNQTFSFVDAASGDFGLQVGDTGAKDFGLTDPALGLFSDDIRGVARPQGSAWDIGAREGV